MIKITQILVYIRKRTQLYDDFYFIIASVTKQYKYEVPAFENTTRALSNPGDPC